MDERQTVAGIALAILNERLRPFLAKWHPELSQWEGERTKRKTSGLMKQECRKELEELRLTIVTDTAHLRRNH